MKKLIRITPELIEASVIGSTTECVVALGIKTVVKEGVRVGVGLEAFSLGWPLDMRSGKLPTKGKKAVRQFDFEGPSSVEPVAFYVNIPEEYVK